MAIYRIAAVAEMTGVPAATLRAWERRYGVPTPRRTSSAYRVYDDQDVGAIRELLSLRQDGMSAADSAKVVQERLQLREASQAKQQQAAPKPFESLRAELLHAVCEFDHRGLEASLAKLVFAGKVSTIFEQVIAPMMVEVGELWHAGRISVGQEHMATQLLEGAARDMLRMLEHSDRARNVVLACFADESHTLPLYGVAYRMVRWGFRPVLLGARTPPSAIAASVRALSPALLGLSLSLPIPPNEARALVEQYVSAAGSVPVVVGGRAAAQLREVITSAGAHVPVDPDMDSLQELVESLVGARLAH